MTEKKKLSTAEILAAARKKSAEGSAAAPAEKTSPPEAAEAEKPAKKESPKKDAPKKDSPQAAGAGGARPSVADILKMARSGGGAKAEAVPVEKPVEKPASKPTAPKADKPAAAKVEKPAPKGKEEKVAPTGPKDTASILAAARQGAKPGPITKQEAATRQSPVAPAAKAPAKGKTAVPPMPAKPDSAKPKAKAVKGDDEDRRGFLTIALGTALGLGFTALSATFGLWGLGLARFMFPNVLTEPPSQFMVGFPSEFPPGSVADKFKAQFGVWVVNYEYNGKQQIYALRTVCTHLGCTPNWLEGEQKFKCPCHGSGFYKDGINFEGPAPRPLERFAIRVADDGQIEIDKSQLFLQEKGEWQDPASFIPV